ncbi:hypothetical protein B296_00006697 [Ensete ventricosum]|uniref:Uncharacterized protein n=1 Tax=Ensete ventricosum TaxID=4639 RepID=A0A426ZTL3_ENSVE|nr:hypothetical protein B296_00006697 [Ensete ventricosum]
MRWDLAGSSLGDSPKESRSSLGTRREIFGKKTRGLAARLPEVAGVCGNKSRVGISVILIQDDRPLFRIEAFPTLHLRLPICKRIIVATEFKVWLDIGP